MITEAEVRRLAGRWGVDLMIVDLDYVQACFLATFYRQSGAAALRFKGGTCLKKCYFRDYRFSRDLDFTATRRIGKQELERLLAATVAEAEDRWQVDFRSRSFEVKVVNDEYGKESQQARLYYRGPLVRRGDPQVIRLDITREEALIFRGVKRKLLHPYSDAKALAGVRIPCYDVLEMMAEKLRALAGQRTYAISRDLYDIDQVTTRRRVNVARLVAALPAKMKVKGMAPDEIDLKRLHGRRTEFRRDWDRNLANLLSPGTAPDFDETWDRTMQFIDTVNRRLKVRLGTED
jgi:predicted nucleotidyltransferase component of viral defense system